MEKTTDNLSKIRSFMFGVQDSLGSTLGFVSGIAVSGVDRQTILTSGIVLIFVEAFSMGIGSLLSEHTTREFEEGKALPISSAIPSSLIMFFSYFFSGFIPLAPYTFATPGFALLLSVLFSLALILTVSLITATKLKLDRWHHIREMLILGTVTLIVGMIVGKILPEI